MDILCTPNIWEVMKKITYLLLIIPLIFTSCGSKASINQNQDAFYSYMCDNGYIISLSTITEDEKYTLSNDLSADSDKYTTTVSDLPSELIKPAHTYSNWEKYEEASGKQLLKFPSDLYSELTLTEYDDIIICDVKTEEGTLHIDYYPISSHEAEKTVYFYDYYSDEINAHDAELLQSKYNNRFDIYRVSFSEENKMYAFTVSGNYAVSISADGDDIKKFKEILSLSKQT